MALPYLFANVTVLRTPELDSDFAAVGALTIIPCTATGTNTLALTPASNTPTVSAYSNSAPIFAFKAAASNSGAVTINVNGIGAKSLYKNNGQTAVASGDLILNAYYLVAYNSALNASAGGFILVNQGASAAAAGSIQGTFKNLQVSSSGASTTQVAITADAVAVSDGSTNFTTLLSVSVTANGSTSGANGLDTGSITTSSWYFVYVIYNPTSLTTASLLSLSATSPTLPSGYTQWARVGAQRTDGSSKFLNVLQKNYRAQYVVGSNPTVMPNIANSSGGATGTYSTTAPTLASQSVSSVVPSTAGAVSVASTTQWKGGISANLLVAPSTSYGGANNGPRGSNGQMYPITGSGVFDMTLEATTIGWCSDNTGAAISCVGWIDNL